MKISRKTIAAKLMEERRTNRLMSPRYKDTPAQIRTKVYGNVRIVRHGVTSTTLEPTAPGQYGDSTGEAFPPYAWPGGYTIEFIADDGPILCAACAREAVLANGETLHYDTYDEGPDMYCDGCNAVLESSYGDPDAEEEEETEAPADPVAAMRAAVEASYYR